MFNIFPCIDAFTVVVDDIFAGWVYDGYEKLEWEVELETMGEDDPWQEEDIIETMLKRLWELENVPLLGMMRV